MLNRIAVIMAGQAAQHIYAKVSGRFDLDDFKAPDDRDFEEALYELDNLRLPPSSKQRPEILAREWQRARAILVSRWIDVAALVNALLDRARTETRGQIGEFLVRISGHTLAELTEKPES